MGNWLTQEIVVTPQKTYLIPTLEAYINQRVAERRAEAARHIQQQKAPNVPRLPSRTPWSIAAGILGMSDEERIRRFGTTAPQTCIYTATSQFNDAGAVVPGNKTFRKNPESYGFREVPMDSAQIGDLIQFTNEMGTPHHGTLMTGRDAKGKPLVSYSNGSYLPFETYFNGDTQKEDTVWTMKSNQPISAFTGQEGEDWGDTPAAFRYEGSPQQRYQWGQEYLKKYNLDPKDFFNPFNPPPAQHVEQPDALRVAKPRANYRATGGSLSENAAKFNAFLSK